MWDMLESIITAMSTAIVADTVVFLVVVFKVSLNNRSWLPIIIRLSIKAIFVGLQIIKMSDADLHAVLITSNLSLLCSLTLKKPSTTILILESEL